MAEAPNFDPTRTAVLAMDCQTGIVTVYVKDQDAFLARAANVLEHARRSGMCVIHVQVGFRPGLPEVSSRNSLFAAIKASPEHHKFFEGDSGRIHPRLGPQPGDIVVTKHRVSAFHGTDLQVVLRAQEIDTLVLLGIATSGVVLSTLLEASDADYRAVVIRDCCADHDAELHSCLLERFFPKRGTVISAAQFLGTIA